VRVTHWEKSMAKRPVRKRTKRAPRRASSAAPPVVTIRARARGALVERTVSAKQALLRLAEEWTYVLRSRARWLDDQERRELVRNRALRALGALGITRNDVKQFGAADHVEVELHATGPQDAPLDAIQEAAAELPWEYLISAATHVVGRHQDLLVTRVIRNDARVSKTSGPRRVFFIESAPGRLDDEYDFASERRRIQAAVGADAKTPDAGPKASMDISATEALEVLADRVRKQRWDVLHVTGVDTHQAAWMINSLYSQDELQGDPIIWKSIVDDQDCVEDGMIFRGADVAEHPVTFRALADSLIDRRNPPKLVTLNLYYSGARIAREMVRRGAFAAVGFLDEIDDELAERFYQALYWAWSRTDATDVTEAFGQAWAAMDDPRLQGTGIVIWVGRSMIDAYRPSVPEQVPIATAPAARAEAQQRLALLPIREVLEVDLAVPDEINYSLLHNDRPLLDRLTLSKLVPEPLENIGVTVELNLGQLNYPYRCTYTVLDEPQVGLAPQVHIPLTATLPRALRERVHSTVYVKVTYGDRVARESTERVTLIPVDEWLDDTKNNPWLPSFVLPRDPALLAIIMSSRRYLIGIEDDPGAGFDGYQAVDDSAEDPSAGVDAQVQAIWTALVNEYRFQYINPPPAYSDRTQRLRTPSDIVASNSGTCIDLSLLLASCLEYVDIYPVVVLLEGHAFAGYWRSADAYETFANVERVPSKVPPAGSPLARIADVRLVEPYGWRLTKLHYDEIMEYVKSGDLAMLEATSLTEASSFADARSAGRDRMRSRDDFDSLLDIKLARSAKPAVTPIPILHE
jgi:hypothetical protein